MEFLLKMLKRDRTEHLLIALMVVFILFEVQIPRVVGTMVGSIGGRVALLISAVALLFTHPILGAIALVAAYVLVHRSEKSTGQYQARRFIPSEYTKNKQLHALNQFPVTLEEEMVHKMVPFVNKGNASPSKFTPTQDKLHGAAKL